MEGDGIESPLRTQQRLQQARTAPDAPFDPIIDVWALPDAPEMPLGAISGIQADSQISGRSNQKLQIAFLSDSANANFRCWIRTCRCTGVHLGSQ